jgi:histidine triad (HIT) family protein
MDDCLFCKIINKNMPSFGIYEDEQVYAFLDIHPVNLGHVVIVPKEHAVDLRESDKAVMAHLMNVIQEIGPKIAKAVGAEAFNVASNVGRAAGQVIFHTHLHIIPRFPADGHVQWIGKDEHVDFESVKQQILDKLQ